MSAQVDLEGVDNQEDWNETVELFGDDGGKLDLTDATSLAVKVWSETPRSEVLSGALGGALTIEDAPNGIVSIHFGASDMQRLCPREYNWSLRGVIGGETRTLILGTLPVLDGGT
jgi:hypothetical protein